MDRTNDHDEQFKCAASPGEVSFLKTMAAPWLILSPSRASRNMTGGSRWAFWLSFGLGVLLLAAVIVLLAMWEETVISTWGGSRSEREVIERSMADVWRDWHAGGWFGPAAGIAVGVFLGVPFLAAVAAWLYLPSVHRGGSVWRSFRRSFGAVGSGVGLLIVGVAGVGVPAVMGSLISTRGTTRFFEDEEDFLAVFATASSVGGLCLLLYWLGRAALAAAGPVADVEHPPRCEGCGYDLTHRPVEDRCPECGSSISASLRPGVRRPGCAWQTRLVDTFWISTSVAVVFAPTKFYRGLMLRRPEREYRQFAVWHYPAIAGLAAVWLVCVVTQVAGSPPGLVVLGPAFSALAGWCVHRLVGAAMTSWAIVRGALPDVTWAAKVMAYETAFLWVFCLYNGLLLTSFAVFGDWISDHVLRAVMVGSQFGFPAEPFAVLVGNAAIIAAWMWRYVVAFRCVQWSNF